jgi:hypothetical protein
MRFSCSRAMRWTSKLVSAMLSHSFLVFGPGHLNKCERGKWFRKKTLQIAIRRAVDNRCRTFQNRNNNIEGAEAFPLHCGDFRPTAIPFAWSNRLNASGVAGTQSFKKVLRGPTPLIRPGLGRSANARFSDPALALSLGRLQRRPYQAGHECAPGTATKHWIAHLNAKLPSAAPAERSTAAVRS